MYNCYKLWTARYWYRYIITSFVRRLQMRSVEWRRRWWWAVSESLGVLSVEKSNACIRESCAQNLFYLHVFFFYLLLSFFFSLPSKYIYIFMCVYNITRRHVRCFTRFTCTYHAPTVQTIIYYRLSITQYFSLCYTGTGGGGSSLLKITPTDSLRVILATSGVSTSASIYFGKEKNFQYKTRTLANEYC